MKFTLVSLLFFLTISDQFNEQRSRIFRLQVAQTIKNQVNRNLQNSLSTIYNKINFPILNSYNKPNLSINLDGIPSQQVQDIKNIDVAITNFNQPTETIITPIEINNEIIYHNNNNNIPVQQDPIIRPPDFAISSTSETVLPQFISQKQNQIVQESNFIQQLSPQIQSNKQVSTNNQNININNHVITQNIDSSVQPLPLQPLKSVFSETNSYFDNSIYLNPYGYLTSPAPRYIQTSSLASQYNQQLNNIKRENNNFQIQNDLKNNQQVAHIDLIQFPLQNNYPIETSFNSFPVIQPIVNSI